MTGSALVTILMPLRDGEELLPAALEALQSQAHENWRLVAVDNQSGDRSLELLRHAARIDARIMVRPTDRWLSEAGSLNLALRQIPAASRWCMLLPLAERPDSRCLSRLLELAGQHPEAGVIAGRRLRGNVLEGGGLPERRSLFRGAHVARLLLRRHIGGRPFVGALVRADLLRGRHHCISARYQHPELGTFFDLLGGTDFGFLDDVLLRADQPPPPDERHGLLRDRLLLLQDFGPRYFGEALAGEAMAECLRDYHGELLRLTVSREGRRFLRYHLAALRQAGLSPGLGELAMAACREAKALLRQHDPSSDTGGQALGAG